MRILYAASLATSLTANSSGRATLLFFTSSRCVPRSDCCLGYVKRYTLKSLSVLDRTLRRKAKIMLFFMTGVDCFSSFTQQFISCT
ncbi:unnamed protein product [Calicophoron daubneyi]|uniref:Secreted protein n=1 Tax=Calicophoron daubneyi TaxID=300641 RepID=A0AAV2TZJ2_CALDB